MVAVAKKKKTKVKAKTKKKVKRKTYIDELAEKLGKNDFLALHEFLDRDDNCLYKISIKAKTLAPELFHP